MVEYVQGRFGTKATVRGELTREDVVQMRRFGTQDLDLNYARGWIPTDLAFLRQLPWLKRLSVCDYSLRDLEPVHELADLRSLHIRGFVDAPVRADAFPNLAECGIDPWRTGSEGVFDCTGLRRLYMGSYSGRTSEPFGNLVNLEELFLLECSLEEVEHFASLKRVSRAKITHLRNLKSLDGIQGMTSLDDLELGPARQVTSIEPVSHLPKIRRINLEVGKVPSISCLREAPSLVHVVLDPTVVEDGDMSVLLDLPNLLLASYTEKSHYKPRKKDLKKAFASRAESVVVI